jgi:hypothetical protein
MATDGDGQDIGPIVNDQDGKDRPSPNFGNRKSTQRNTQQGRRLHLHHGAFHKPQINAKFTLSPKLV